MSDNQRQGQREIVVEMQGVDRLTLARIWEKMRAGVDLTGEETYLGRAMADHPEHFPLFETMEIFDTAQGAQAGEQSAFAHLTFHFIIGSQIHHQNPPEAETFYRMRLRAGDNRHDVVHMMINVFQRHLAWAAQNANPEGQAAFDLAAYGATLKTLWPLKTKKVWERLGYEVEPPSVGGAAARAASKRRR